MRQIRLSTELEIQNRSKELTGKKINIVLHDRKVLFGVLVGIEQGELTFADMRQQRITLPLHKISEVYLDFRKEC